MEFDLGLLMLPMHSKSTGVPPTITQAENAVEIKPNHLNNDPHFHAGITYRSEGWQIWKALLRDWDMFCSSSIDQAI